MPRARLALVSFLLALATACELPVVDTGGTPADTGSDLDPVDPVELQWPEFGNQPVYPDGGYVYGHVVSPGGGLGVAGAIIALEVDGVSVWTMSLDGGRFRLQLPPGTWNLGVSKGRYAAAASAQITQGTDVDVGDIRLDAGDVGVAVVYGEYDDIGALIAELGIPAQGFPTVSSLLDDPDLLASYDVVFLNCGSDATRTSAGGYSAQQALNARTFVENGGTLYASDWEWSGFEAIDPDGLQFVADPLVGEVGIIDATVLDREIQTLLGGATARLSYDLSQWALPSAAGTAEVLIEGVAPGSFGTRPLAVVDHLGTGRVIFTTFHNEAQTTQDMELILYEMILSL